MGYQNYKCRRDYHDNNEYDCCHMKYHCEKCCDEERQTHVHLVVGRTSINDGHFHEFLFTTQINAPLV
ncbi:MAG: YmaF family protein [Clostridium perfringens]|nr:YmaF family protein [Clostridium perfringens]